MSQHCFFVPARAPEPAQSELNAFLAAQRVLAVQREWLADDLCMAHCLSSPRSTP